MPKRKKSLVEELTVKKLRKILVKIQIDILSKHQVQATLDDYAEALIKDLTK